MYIYMQHIQTYSCGARAIGSSAQQDPDTVQSASLTGQEEGCLTPLCRRIHSSSGSQQRLYAAERREQSKKHVDKETYLYRHTTHIFVIINSYRRTVSLGRHTK